ncbi:MAG: PKD domain-containing protein, partial [Ginsengibacter sp.]
MKNIFLLSLLSVSFFKSSVIAQTSISCNAKFSWQYISNNVIQFNPLSAGDTINTHHYWLFGDGDSTTIVVPTHTYLTGDSFIVKHFVYKTNLDRSVECRDSFKSVIQIASCNIRPGYSWVADSANTSKIIFTNQTTTATTDASAIWYFGDGTYGTGWNTFHEYNHPGRYYVCLRIQTDSTCRSYHCDSITVSSSSPCNIRPGYSWVTDSANTSKIIFTNQTTTATTDASA